MDPQAGSNRRPAQVPVDRRSANQARAPDAETTGAPVSAVAKLTIDNNRKAKPASAGEDSFSAHLSTIAPVVVFKQDPENNDTAPSKMQKICGVCDKEPGKYKCPRCGMFYCSVPCSKTHKANHPPDLPSASSQLAQSNPQASNGTKRAREPEDPFSTLMDHMPDIERLLDQYPNLRDDLNQIANESLPPPDAFPSASAGGLPTKYQPPQHQQRQKEPWTRQVGLRKAAAALKKARTDPGEDGDAVREYCELVMHLLSQDKERKAEEREALDVLRKETEDEEKLVIKKLLKEEED